jgi:protein SCO1/2
LSQAEASQVQGVFVSVDPERDSPEALGIFARGFFPGFVGLTGERNELDSVARQYGFIYERVPLKDSAMGYVIDHSSIIYLIDRQGVLQAYIPHDTSPQKIKQELLKLLS